MTRTYQAWMIKHVSMKWPDGCPIYYTIESVQRRMQGFGVSDLDEYETVWIGHVSQIHDASTYDHQSQADSLIEKANLKNRVKSVRVDITFKEIAD